MEKHKETGGSAENLLGKVLQPFGDEHLQLGWDLPWRDD